MPIDSGNGRPIDGGFCRSPKQMDQAFYHAFTKHFTNFAKHFTKFTKLLLQQPSISPSILHSSTTSMAQDAKSLAFHELDGIDAIKLQTVGQG